MPASLSTLPPECLNQIVGSVGKCGWLLDLALTCRSLYRLALPYLYSDIRLVYHGPMESFPYLRLLTVRLLNDEKLASYVRSFALSDCWSSPDDPSEAEAVDNVHAALTKAVHRFSHSSEEAEEWIDDLKKGYDEDAYLALLLPSLPNLESLNLQITALPQFERYFSRIIMQRIPRRQKPFDLQPAFASLKIVVNNCFGDKYGTSPDLLSSCLRLPSLQEYYCEKVGSADDETNESLAQLETASSALTHLELRESKMNTQDLANVLRACKDLKTFVYELGWNNLSYGRYSTPELSRPLDFVHDSLENLWLDNSPGCSYWGADGSTDLSPIGSLAGFKVLKNLKVGVYVLFGEDQPQLGRHSLKNAERVIWDEKDIPSLASVLPESLETLYFSHTNGRVTILTKALENLLKQKELAMPSLRRTAYEAYITGNDQLEHFDFSPLDDLANGVNVEIRRIDGTAIPAANSQGWEYTSGVDDKGQGMDGSLTWAARLGGESSTGFALWEPPDC